MSGVIDKNGQQWERCGQCRKFVKFESLRYEKPSRTYKYGRDLCGKCAIGKWDGTLYDQLTKEEADKISKEVRENIKQFGLKVRTMNPDGTWTDNSIPPESGATPKQRKHSRAPRVQFKFGDWE